MELKLPAISLNELPMPTRDWLLATSAQEGKDPQSVLRETLDRAAARAGFSLPVFFGELGGVDIEHGRENT